jgi:transcription initiation factor TFIIH subunit 2
VELTPETTETVGKSNNAAVSSAPVVASSYRTGAVSKLNTDLLVSSEDDEQCCYACLRPIGMHVNASKKSNEDLLQFRCPDCNNIFCVQCDAFLHGILHNYPGCLAI